MLPSQKRTTFVVLLVLGSLGASVPIAACEEGAGNARRTIREPREALWLAALAFLAHALLDLAHRPGWLSTDVFPRAYLIGCAVYDGCLAGICFLARQRS